MELYSVTGHLLSHRSVNCPVSESSSNEQTRLGAFLYTMTVMPVSYMPWPEPYRGEPKSSTRREDIFGLPGFSENKFKICVLRILFHPFFFKLGCRTVEAILGLKCRG